MNKWQRGPLLPDSSFPWRNADSGSDTGLNDDKTFSENGIAFTDKNEGHHNVLYNGNYEVKDTGDGKLTTYGGLTIAELKDGKWVPINGFTQEQVNNRDFGINKNDWRKNFDTYIKNAEAAIKKFANDNDIELTQGQFDALVDFAYTNGYQAFKKQDNGKYIYDFMNLMTAPGFFEATLLTRYDFDCAFGNQVSMGGKRTAGMWARRMSQLGVFWGDVDSDGNYIRKEYGNGADTKKAADAWLTQRGLDPTVR